MLLTDLAYIHDAKLLAFAANIYINGSRSMVLTVECGDIDYVAWNNKVIEVVFIDSESHFVLYRNTYEDSVSSIDRLDSQWSRDALKSYDDGAIAFEIVLSSGSVVDVVCREVVVNII